MRTARDRASRPDTCGLCLPRSGGDRVLGHEVDGQMSPARVSRSTSVDGVGIPTRRAAGDIASRGVARNRVDRVDARQCGREDRSSIDRRGARPSSRKAPRPHCRHGARERCRDRRVRLCRCPHEPGIDDRSDRRRGRVDDGWRCRRHRPHHLEYDLGVRYERDVDPEPSAGLHGGDDHESEWRRHERRIVAETPGPSPRAT